MIEPYWDEVYDRMMKLTLKQLKPVFRWFVGSLGGAYSKSAKCSQAVTQMRYWWENVEGGQGRVNNILKVLEEAERS